jgi:hypothetical protein
MDLREIGWTGLIWFRIGTSGGLLWTQYWTFEFHKMLNSWVAVQLAASQEGLKSMELRLPTQCVTLRCVLKGVHHGLFWGFTLTGRAEENREKTEASQSVTDQDLEWDQMHCLCRPVWQRSTQEDYWYWQVKSLKISFIPKYNTSLWVSIFIISSNKWAKLSQS